MTADGITHGVPRQRGFTLISILLMVTVLAALAVAGMGASLMQERMAGNARDRSLAMQAAEAALRDAESDIEASITPDSDFASGCADGLCLPPSMSSSSPSSVPLWQTLDWSASAGLSRAYGSRTGVAALAGVAQAPRYIVELLPPLPPASGQSAGTGVSLISLAQAYRITVRATGARSTTVVVLQSTYIKQ